MGGQRRPFLGRGSRTERDTEDMRERAGGGRVFVDREHSMWKNFEAGVSLLCFKEQGKGECWCNGR